MKTPLIVKAFCFMIVFFELSPQLFSQNNSELKPCGSLNMAEKLEGMYTIRNTDISSSQKTAPVNLTPVNKPSSISSNITNPIISAPFTRISGSMDIFGNLYTNSKPLQYNKYLNCLSFIHRKSATYTPVSDGNAGTIVAMIGRNYGATWDSTCLWTNTLNIAQTPQGGLYNPPGNFNVNNSYVVATGATMSGTNVTGSFFASKATTSVGTNAPGADQQFFANIPSFSTTASPLMTKQDFSQFGFSSTDDGIVRTVGMIYNDANASTDAAKGIRGAKVARGAFNAGVFVWTADSFIPPTLIKTDGSKQLWSQPYMAWNSPGTVGYVVMIGCRQSSTLSNVGWQPIIYKTTNSGNNWNLVNGIDFNSGNFNFVLNSMSAINSNSLTKVPFFDPFEGIDLAIDLNDKLHIVTTVQGTAKSHVDSLTYIHQYTMSSQPPTEKYSWQYKNTAWPYIFDFIGDGATQWIFRTVDSIGTEGPSNLSTMPGFTYNPWANQNQVNPVSSTMRIQISRSYYGGIMYTWAETDTTLTTNTTKWNEFPNIHARALRVCDLTVSSDELILSSPPSGFSPRVRDKAFFHHVSPLMQCVSGSPTSATYTIPLSVSNNIQTNGGMAVDHFLSKAIVVFSFPASGCGFWQTSCEPVNLESTVLDENKLSVFPNPFHSSFNLNFKLTQAEAVSIEVYNCIGQKISSTKMNALSGENTFEIKNAEQLEPGLYFIKLKTINGDAVKKLIKE